MEDYAELIRKGIEVDDDNYPDPNKITQTNNTTATADTELDWTGVESIVCQRLSRKLPSIPASVNNYSNEDVMKI